jgi:LL-diaminopimelate aminotransferase
MSGLSLAIFSEMADLAAKAQEKGLDVINLGIGSPDGTPDEHIRTALKDGVEKPEAFGYPCTEGCHEFREAVAFWYKRRFNADLDPKSQVHSLMGSQDGLAHLALGYINPGDIALIPDPGYPIYSASIALAGGLIYPIKLTEETGYLPDFDNIPEDVATKSKLMLLNYPNNPLTVTADLTFW